MQHSPKYHIHAEIRADGVVERSDVVGAIFGQTEGLLGDELDLRELQDSSRVGRIDVDIDSEDGRSFGTVTIASALDRVETAVLAAALETMERVGPCYADCTVTEIEDARAAKRRTIVDRASELLNTVERTEMSGEKLVEEVRKQARVAEITEYEGLPAGPRVADSDAIILVEGRADVRQLLEYGIRNAIAVEGTNVPDAVADLTRERKTTAFLDGDRGGDLILEELLQIADVDYVAFAPSDQSVEDLDRQPILNALRKKIPADQVADDVTPREAYATPAGHTPVEDVGSEETAESHTADGGIVDTTADASDGDTATESTDEPSSDGRESSVGDTDVEPAPGEGDTDVGPAPEEADTDAGATPGDGDIDADPAAGVQVDDGGDMTEETTDPGQESSTGVTADSLENVDNDDEGEDPAPSTLAGHVTDVIGDGSGRVRLLDASFEMLTESDADEAFAMLEAATDPPHTVIVDGTVTQRLLDVAAQRGIGQLVGRNAGEFVKQPTSVRVRTAEEFAEQPA